MNSPLLADTLSVVRVMNALAERRPVFHSEADFQFAFSQTVVQLDPMIEVRLEVRQGLQKAEYVDLVCYTPKRRTLVELKYPTTRWIGTLPDGEEFALRHHAAYDLARRYFVHDLSRLETFIAHDPHSDGVAILLTNEPGMWTSGTRVTRDADFRVDEGRTLTGNLMWGAGGTPYDEVLAGRYVTDWSDFSDVGGARGRFRYLALAVS